MNSDIRDWNPAGGPTAPVSASTWGIIPYAWGEDPADIPQRVESQWYIYWMQSMPGHANAIVSGGQRMTNWWLLTENWDAAIAAGYGLHRPNTVEVDTKPSRSVGLRTWPNPTSGSINVEYVLPIPERVTVDVFDVTGHHVRTLDRGLRSEGRHSIGWHGEGPGGRAVKAGVYYVVLARQDGTRQVTRVVRLR